MDRAALDAALGVDWNGAPYVVLLYHPTITDYAAAAAHIASIADVLKNSGLRVAAMAPNTDPGADAVQAGDVGPGQHYGHAGQGGGRCGPDGRDAGMGVGAGQNLGVEQAFWRGLVADEAGRAGDVQEVWVAAHDTSPVGLG